LAASKSLTATTEMMRPRGVVECSCLGVGGTTPVRPKIAALTLPTH